jgi:hypothetical protein
MLTFDHTKLVNRQPREMKKLRRYLLGLQRGQVQEMTVAHEDDGACCGREAWPVTFLTITRALKLTTVYVAAAGEPE